MSDVVTIPLTKGFETVIDAADQHLVFGRWHSHTKKGARVIYAAQTIYRPGQHPQLVLMHRKLLGLTDPKILGDHRDGDGLNNRRGNLRVRDHTGNVRNSGLQSNSGRYLGVTWNRRDQRWQARIMVDGSSKSLGYFPTAEEANIARLRAECELWGIEPLREAAHNRSLIDV